MSATGRCFACDEPCAQSTCTETPYCSAPDESVRQNESSDGSWSLSTGAKQKWARLSGRTAAFGKTKTGSTESGSCGGIATIEAAGWPSAAAQTGRRAHIINRELTTARRATTLSGFGGDGEVGSEFREDIFQ